MAEKLRPDFLIVGMERSGSLWTSATLNAHPDIASFPALPFQGPNGELRVGEVHFFNTLATVNGENPSAFTRPIEDWLTKYGKVFADLVEHKDKIPKKEFIAMCVRRYSDYCDRQRGNKKIVGESTPAYVFHLDFIDSLYPSMQKICIMRDPKDKIVSWHFSLVSKGRRNEKEVTEDFALDYLRERIVKEYEALLAYKGWVHCITYEKMTVDPVRVIKGMLSYLGVGATDEIISHMIQEASFENMTLRHTKKEGRQRGEEVSGDSMRKGVVGDFKAHMTADLAETIDEAVADVRAKVFTKYDVEN
ncbi:MAG: sulfotransferase domain-containing protein [Parcubacteria group bacterium]|nr:sulfotransferase domain-containing protein [Parcubacteria group bacterium]